VPSNTREARIFGTKTREKQTKLHTEELHNLYSSPSVIRVIRSRSMRQTGHITHMQEKLNVHPKGRKFQVQMGG
jgi:hypothetical protein